MNFSESDFPVFPEPEYTVPIKPILSNRGVIRNPSPNIPGASIKYTIAGKYIEKLKTPVATFSLKPIANKPNSYTVQVTCKELPGLFKNSGSSSFGGFIVTRYPGRNEVRRPKAVGPVAGNAVLMWPNIMEVEQQRCLEYVEKLIRERIPRMEANSPKPNLN